MPATQRDYYEILGVEKGASVDDVKKAYRQLVLKCHPDRVAEDKKKEAEAQFKEISEAYAVLSDPQKRQLYDQYGHSGIDSRYSTDDIFRNADFSEIFGGSGFSSVFEELFGGGGFDAFSGGGRRSGGRQRRGEDINAEAAITLEQAAFGTEKTVSYTRYDNCGQCQGTGAASGTKKETCGMCGGHGVVSSGRGFISFSQTCPKCSGAGSVIKNPCGACSGAGRVRQQHTLTVNIPAGVDTGSVLRLRDEGHHGPSGRGEFYLHIAVKPHEVFERQGSHVRCRYPISVIKAILGGDADVPTLTGKVRMKIPPGTQPSAVFRLKGKGIVDLHSKRIGDQMVEIEIKIPEKLSNAERKLLNDWAKLRQE